MVDAIGDFSMHLEASGYRLRAPLIADNRFHRIYYDGEKSSSGRYSLLVHPNGFGVGYFGSDKDPQGFRAWCSTSKEKLSVEDRRAFKRLQEEAQAARDEEATRQHLRVSQRLERATRNLVTAETHPYLSAKGVGPHGIWWRERGNRLVIPMYGSDGRIWSIQQISANGKWKASFKGGRMKGSYYPIARPEDDKSVIVICEGFATGASIREATGYPVMVAFSAGNLRPVAEAIRAASPASRLIIAADNDRFTRLKNGAPNNVGILKAVAAAKAVGAAVVVRPEFPESDLAGTDFNDLHLSAGLDCVREKIAADLAAAHEIRQETAEEADPGFQASGVPEPDLHPGVGDAPDGEYGAAAPDEYEEQRGDFEMNFRVLGFNNGVFYYFPFHARQIVGLTAGAHTINQLLQLDNLSAWENRFGVATNVVDKEGNERTVRTALPKVALFAQNAMMALARSRGVFNEGDRVRGAGAWLDEGRVVLHCGDVLYVDGELRTFDQLKSHFTYVAAQRVMRPADEPLAGAQAIKLRRICEAVTWENPLSGALLAGWLVIAPICAALNYRPHLYITGEAESGKSTVMDRIIKPVLGHMSLNFDGGTTEPAIRDSMGYDGRPLVFDEGEPSASMPEVISLARKATTGSVVKKFGQRAFKARFCACFSAINPPVSKTADESRISFMVIKKNRGPNAIAEYEDLVSLINETITPEFSSKLIARTLAHMPALLENIEIFQKAVRMTIGGARAAQQVGTMIAGLYLLSRTDVVTLEVARQWVERYEWADHTNIDQQTDPLKLVQHMAGALVRHGKSASEISIGDLVSLVVKDRDAQAKNQLRYYGIVVEDSWVVVASTSQNMRRLLAGTDWEEKWSRTLNDVQGSEKRKCVYFSPGVRTSGIAIPLNLFINEETDEPDHYDDPDAIPY